MKGLLSTKLAGVGYGVEIDPGGGELSVNGAIPPVIVFSLEHHLPPAVANAGLKVPPFVLIESEYIVEPIAVGG